MPSIAKSLTLTAALLPLAACAQAIRSDPLTNATMGPPLEVVHLFEGQWPTGTSQALKASEALLLLPRVSTPAHMAYSSTLTPTRMTHGLFHRERHPRSRSHATGIAVSSTGRKFTCYPGGLDPTNVNQGLPGIFTVGEITGMSTEAAYPNVSYNTPPGGAVDRLTVPPKTKGLSGYLLGVQSVVVDELDTLWILDTGRVIDFSDPLHAMLQSQPGGPKLVAVDLATNKVRCALSSRPGFLLSLIAADDAVSVSMTDLGRHAQVVKTITFPADVVLPFSYINDVRIDRSPNLSGISGKEGAAYVSPPCPACTPSVPSHSDSHQKKTCRLPTPPSKATTASSSSTSAPASPGAASPRTRARTPSSAPCPLSTARPCTRSSGPWRRAT